MARQGDVSGIAVLALFSGAVLAYSGVKGKGIGNSIRALIAGNNPSTLPTTQNIDTGSIASVGVGVSNQTAVTGSGSSAIYKFLKAKGLTAPQIAGIMGNLQVESGFNPQAYNAGEGAIGIAQWELGRRQALQAYAAAHGGKETDLNIQLNYLWTELTQSYGSAYLQLRGATTAEQAATIWDSQYEGSAGTTRGQRISAAQSWLSKITGGLLG